MTLVMTPSYPMRESLAANIEHGGATRCLQIAGSGACFCGIIDSFFAEAKLWALTETPAFEFVAEPEDEQTLGFVRVAFRDVAKAQEVYGFIARRFRHYEVQHTPDPCAGPLEELDE